MLSAGRGEAVFVAAGLPPAPASRTYQLWLVGPAGARSAGLLATGSGGGGTRLLTGIDGAERVALTVEPGGGSSQPTSAPVLVVDL